MADQRSRPGWPGAARSGAGPCRVLGAVLLVCSAQAGLRVSATESVATPSEPGTVARLAGQFDCADGFDLVALSVVYRCAAYAAPDGAAARIDAALARLRAVEALARMDVPRVEFCPLAQGTGMVPAPDVIYLDDGLLELGTDGLAEIIAHELAHVGQFARLGAHGFKCAYVRAMLACGGCQDRRHALEAEAYARQDAVRARLLAQPPELSSP